MQKISLILIVAMLFLAGCQETKYVHVGPNWKALHELQPSDNTFKVTGYVGEKYRLGEELDIKVTSEKSGRLWVVHVDSKDYATKLYPNTYVPDNTIKAGETISIPVMAAEPTGASVVAFIVTESDTNLSDVIDGQNNMEKALYLARKAPAWGLDIQVVDIVE